MEPPSFRSGKCFCTVKSAPFHIDAKYFVKVLFRHRFERSEFSQPALAKTISTRPLALTVL